MAFSIYKKCSDRVEYGGKEWRIDMAFDNVLMVRDILDNGSMTERQQITAAFAYLVADQELATAPDLDYDTKQGVVDLAINELIGEDAYEKVVEYDRQGNPMPGQMADLADDDDTVQKGTYSLDYDATYIYTGFMQAYGIDLHRELGKLHWQEFQALLRDLPQETAFGEIVKIRGTKLSEIKDAKERTHMAKLQARYRLPNTTNKPKGA